jgi:DMSO reductase anchor subunit
MDQTRPVTLLPAQPQRLWGWPAVVNFSAGGLGAGLYAVSALAAGFAASPVLGVAAWLGPALVALGFGAVAVEAGRPWRGPRVLARLGSSWMSRELALGALFGALALGEFVRPSVGQRVLALLAALGLALAQGLVLHRARAVAAWAVGIMPLLFLVSALLSGAALHTLVSVGLGLPPSRALLGGLMTLLALGAVAWLAYLGWSHDPAFAQAAQPLRAGRGATLLVGTGYVVPFVLLAVALAWPALAAGAAVLAGTLVVAGQVHAKSALILQAGHLRPVTLPHALRPRRLS